MPVLVLGSLGMLGQALMKEGKARKINIVGADCQGGDIQFDITDDRQLTKLILAVRPSVIINTVALTDIELCEQNPGLAYCVNARPVAHLAQICARTGTYFVHISTDHFFSGDKRLQHKENSKIILLNEYARTKYAAENYALTCPDALAIRTNIVGFRGRKGSPTFAEWVFEVLKDQKPFTMFEDFYTSSITVTQFARYLFDLLEIKPYGILNLASREVASKKKFISSIAEKMSYSLDNAISGSISSIQGVIRAESLGLDVKKAEEILGKSMPEFDEIINQLLYEYRRLPYEL